MIENILCAIIYLSLVLMISTSFLAFFMGDFQSGANSFVMFAVFILFIQGQEILSKLKELEDGGR